MTSDDRVLLRDALAALDAAIERLRPLHLELRRVEDTHWLRRLFMAETGQPAPDEAKAAADLFDTAAAAIRTAEPTLTPTVAAAAAPASTWGPRVWESNRHLAAVYDEATALRRALSEQDGDPSEAGAH